MSMPRKRLSPEVCKEIHAVATPIRKEGGTILFREGKRCRGAFLIRSGQVRLTLDAASRVYPARTVGSGFVIGLPATLSGEPYSLTAQVKNTCRLDYIPRRKLLSLLQKSPQAGFQIVRMLSQEISMIRDAAKRTLDT
jgi:CRP-like cAMP-binding protein